MNGTKVKVAILLNILLLTVISAQAVNIWPDKIKPTIQIGEAVSIAKAKAAQTEIDDLYCVNATLLNSPEKNTDLGYWIIGLTTELGNSYSIAVRMDKKVSLKKVKRFQANTPTSWPDTITPPIRIEEALYEAKKLLSKNNKQKHYCLNASLVSGSDDVVKNGMWNFVYQTQENDPVLLNIRMNGKTKLKEVKKLKEYIHN